MFTQDAAPGVIVASPFPVMSLPAGRAGALPASRGADALADIAAFTPTRRIHTDDKGETAGMRRNQKKQKNRTCGRVATHSFLQK